MSHSPSAPAVVRALQANRREFVLGAMAVAVAGGAATPARAATAPLRLAISLLDLPRMWGSPDGGFEGLRFGGYTVYDALVQWDLSQSEKPCDLVPALAASWRYDDKDRKRMIVTLREGVTFHDGSPFDADAAIWNFAAIFDAKAPQFNAARAAATKSRMPTVVGAEKIDARTIVVTTTVPDASLIYQLSFLLFASPAHFESLGKDWVKFSAQPSGTGPFRVTALIPRTRMDLARNERYWDPKRLPKSETMQILPISDPNSRVSALRAGQVDFIESVPPDAIKSLQGAGLKVSSKIYPHTWNWSFSHLPDSPYHDLRVRKAANLAIDRAGMVDMLEGAAVPARGMVPQNSPWFGKPNFVPTFDLEAARGLMSEAGYGPNNRIKTKTMISNAGGGQMQPVPMNDFIQANLAEIWIDVEYVVTDFATLFTAYRGGAIAPAAKGVHAINVASPVQDPGTAFLRTYFRELTGNGGNWGAYSNPAVETILSSARETFDPAEFDAKLQQVHAMVVDDAASLMVVHDTNPRAMSARVSGFVNPQNWFADFTGVSVA